jgi:RND superfamily putative drug exporter
LPLFIAVVVFLAFLLLIAVFRSLLIPLAAPAMNAVFTWGWGGPILGLSNTGPVDAFLRRAGQ